MAAGSREGCAVQLTKLSLWVPYGRFSIERGTMWLEVESGEEIRWVAGPDVCDVKDDAEGMHVRIQGETEWLTIVGTSPDYSMQEASHYRSEARQTLGITLDRATPPTAWSPGDTVLQ